MFKDKKLFVLGLGVSGRAAARFLLKQEAIVTATDHQIDMLQTHEDIQQLKQLGLSFHDPSTLPGFSSFDYFVISPGIALSHPFIQEAQRAGIPCLGEMALGALFVQHPVLGVTGTNGKTTVTLLTTHVLNHCQQPARALGNVGTPLTQAIETLTPQEKIVLELSSYQLETLHQPVLDVGVILNITPDHLDRYQTLENYAQAKCHIENVLKPQAPLYIEEQAAKDYRHLFKKASLRLYGYHPSCFISTDCYTVFREGVSVFSLPKALQGHPSHEIENLLASFALCADQGVSGEHFLAAYHSFKKPPHRIQVVAQQEGVTFIDDSKGTNVEAVTRAVQSLQGSIHLIAGGVDKGFSYTPWIQVFKDKVKSICAIGQAAAKIQAQLSPVIPVHICQTLEEAVKRAGKAAQPGEHVLLSPGCSSLDMFKDYVHRGQEFQRIVYAWTKEKKA